MVMKKFLMAAMLSSAFLLSGCNEVTPEQREAAQATNQRNMSSPDVVGVLPDGRKIRHVTVVVPNQYSHHVYFVDNATVSTNYSEQHGKVSTMETRVTLSPNPTNDEIIAAAEKLKVQQRAADEAELARLKIRLGIQ